LTFSGVADVTALPGAAAMLGESPVWSASDGALYYVDMPAGVLIRAASQDRDEETFGLGRRYVAAVVPRCDGGWIVLGEREIFALLGDERRALATVAPRGHRLNDAACDAKGRLWVGSVGPRPSDGGALHVYTPSEGLRTAATGFGLPNGLGWSPDGASLYLCDSHHRQLLRAPYAVKDGALGPFATFATVEKGEPDGLCVANDGCVWVAVWDGAELRRYAPDGALLQTVPLPVTRPTNCAFGPDGTLFVTTAQFGLDRAALAAQPLAGRVLAIATPFEGVPVRAFAL
jgi:sugar lactone lactonase YvrE